MPSDPAYAGSNAELSPALLLVGQFWSIRKRKAESDGNISIILLFQKSKIFFAFLTKIFRLHFTSQICKLV